MSLHLWLTSLAMIEKGFKTQIEKRNIHTCKKSIALIKIGLLLVISDNLLSTIRVNNVLPICISY